MKRLLAVFFVLGVILGGCGSSSNDSATPETPSAVLSGTAAAGAPIIGQVTVKDSSTPAKTKSALIEANGNYNIDVTGLLAPFILRAEGSVGGRTYKLHSYAEAADIGGTVNITPFTDLIVANAAGQLASTLFDNGNFSSLTPAEVAAQETALQAKLQAVFTSLGVEATVDLLHTVFSADHTALDAALDMISIETDTNTNIATITNLIDNTSVTDNIASTTDNSTSLQVISDLGTVQTDQAAIFALFDNFSALFVSSLPSSAQLDPFFSVNFLHHDQGKNQFITEISTNPSMIGVAFNHVVINTLDETAGTANVTINFTFNGVTDSDPETWQLTKKDGNWQFLGNQEIVDRYVGFLCAYNNRSNGTIDNGCGISLGADDFNADNNNSGGALLASARVTLMRNDAPVDGGIVYMGIPANGAAGELRVYDNDYSDDYMAFGSGTNQIDPAIFQIGDTLQLEFFTAPLNLTNLASPSITGTPITTYMTQILALPVQSAADSATFPSATQSTLDAFSALTKAGGNLPVTWSLPAGHTIQEVVLMVCDGNNCEETEVSRPAASSAPLTINTSGLNMSVHSFSTELRIYSNDAENREFLHTYQGVAVDAASNPGTVVISGVMATDDDLAVPAPGLTITARHANDIDNSNPIAQTTSGADGSYTLSVPSGTDVYVNASGTSGGTQYAPFNTQIWRNLSQPLDLSERNGPGLIPLAWMNDTLSTTTCGTAACGTMAGKGWFLQDAFASSLDMNDKAAGVSYSLSQPVTFFGYGAGSTYSAPPTQTATAVDMTMSSALGYNATATIISVTASKPGAADQAYELPIIPGEAIYVEIGY